MKFAPFVLATLHVFVSIVPFLAPLWWASAFMFVPCLTELDTHLSTVVLICSWENWS